MPRKRRAFSAEYKAEVVKLIEDSGKSIGQVSRELDLSETAVRKWVAQGEVDAGRGPSGALASEERDELRRLRRENAQLRMEREVLKNPRRPAALPGETETRGLRYTDRRPRGAAVSFLVDYPVKKRGPGTVADPILVTLSSDPG